MTNENAPVISAKRGLTALSPLFLMIALFAALSIYFHDFYKVPLLILFIVASIYALCLLRNKKIEERLAIFSRCAADPNLLLMIWIFILAGAFVSSAKAMGAVDATVNLTLMLIPDNMLLVGLFVASCFVSLSIGTSVGTIAALVPVAAGLAQHANLAMPLIVAAVVGGAFFGDNLSFISDTTVVATQTQGCKMNDKFKTNSFIAIPAALLAIILYIWMGLDVEQQHAIGNVSIEKVLPYIFVLIAALLSINVLVVLTLGILLTGIIGIATGAYDLAGWFECLSAGIISMAELIIISMLAGGLLGVIRELGGISWLLRTLTKNVKSKRGAKYSIAVLVSLTNLCTANNTIAILTVGNLVRNIAQRFNIDSRKTASILDIFSCCIQGCLPYGVQLLMAGGLAAISPLEIIPYLYYPFFLFFIALLAIKFDRL